MSIPQTNPKANYLAHRAEIDQAVARVMESGRYILAMEVSSFESEFAAYIGTKYAIGVGSGTEALHLALRASGIGRGEYVLTSSVTASATAAAIELAGGIPLFVDVDPRTGLIDHHDAERVIAQTGSQRIKAIVPVHLYGYPVNMENLIALAREYCLRVIEDCAQAHGATFNGRKVGGWGHVAAFSFYPTKNLGALGDGGAIVTDDPILAEQARLLREYGWRTRYISEQSGCNSRLDELQAAILRTKLRYLDRDNSRRREIATVYDQAAAQSGLRAIHPGANIEHVYHQYVVMCDRRSALQSFFTERGIASSIHYPMPLHVQPAFHREDCHSGNLQHSETWCQQVLSLPMFPELTDVQVEQVAHAISAWKA